MAVVEWLSCVCILRAVSVSALIAELGDAKRFLGENHVGSYVGLVQSVRQNSKR